MDGSSAERDGWLAQIWSVIEGVWFWWAGLFEVYAWQEIGAYLVPALFLMAVVMFWGMRRMDLGH